MWIIWHSVFPIIIPIICVYVLCIRLSVERKLHYIINVFIQDDSNGMLLRLDRGLVIKRHATGTDFYRHGHNISMGMGIMFYHSRTYSVSLYYDVFTKRVTLMI
jgi:hypothetical protein